LHNFQHIGNSPCSVPYRSVTIRDARLSVCDSADKVAACKQRAGRWPAAAAYTTTGSFIAQRPHHSAVAPSTSVLSAVRRPYERHASFVVRRSLRFVGVSVLQAAYGAKRRGGRRHAEKRLTTRPLVPVIRRHFSILLNSC